MTSPQDRLLRLVAEAQERVGLPLSVDLVKAAGLSKSTVDRFKRGDPVSESTLRKISSAVGWTAESAQNVLAGGNPVSTAEGADTETERTWQREPAAPGDLSQLIRNIVFEAAIGMAPNATAAQIRAVEERAHKLAREAGYTVPRERQNTHIEEDLTP